MSKQLILGGARSGKSYYAEQQALALSNKASALSPTMSYWYVATATAGHDHEMQQRIERHQHDRDACWQLIEEPIDLARIVKQHSHPNDCLLIDCLTLWLTNALLNHCWPEQKQALLDALKISNASIFFVSNEVGSGVVPLGELSRQFVDESGWLHQDLAKQCDIVTLVVAGLPLPLKNIMSHDVNE